MEVSGGVFLARFTFFVAATVAFGTAFFPIYAGRPVEDRDAAWIGKTTLAASVAAFVGAIAWLAFAIIDFGADDLASFVATGRTVLFETPFGLPWLVRLAAAATLVLAAALGVGWVTTATLAALVLGCESLLGHAAIGNVGHHLSQLVHVVAAAAWLGGLLPLSRLLLEALRSPAAADRAPGVLLRFSWMGVVAVALIAATGVINRLYVADPRPHFDSEYDRLFATKVALFLAMVAVAAVNRFHLFPQLDDPDARPPALRVFWWTVGLEQGLGLVLLLVATILGMSSPPE